MLVFVSVDQARSQAQHCPVTPVSHDSDRGLPSFGERCASEHVFLIVCLYMFTFHCCKVVMASNIKASSSAASPTSCATIVVSKAGDVPSASLWQNGTDTERCEGEPQASLTIQGCRIMRLSLPEKHAPCALDSPPECKYESKSYHRSSDESR